MRSELLAVCALLSACAPDVTIGAERLLTVVVTAPTADGRWREAGFRGAVDDADDAADLWYGTTAADGSLPTFSSPARPGADAIRAGVVANGQLVVAGFVTEDGRRLAWVRALDAADAEVWTTTLPSRVGGATEVTALALTNEGSLVVAGIDTSPAGVDGFVALLEATGGVRWRVSFNDGFQGQVRGFVPRAIAAEDAPASPAHRQLWVGGTRGGTGYALQMTLDGDVWDSVALGDPGSVTRGLGATGGAGVALCTATTDGFELATTTGGAFGSVQKARVVVEGFSLLSCSGSSSTVKALGSLGGLPTVLTVRPGSPPVVTTQSAATRAELFGGADSLDGAVRLVGRTSSPLRRWSARVSPQ